MRKNIKLTLGLLTVLATPFAVNSVSNHDAQAATGWVKSGNTWYYYNNNGQQVRNAWAGSYYLKADGRMASNEWIYDNYYKGWYYLKADGSYAANAWAGNYWLGADGRMATNSWVDNNKYYVGENGAWVPSVNNGWMKENNAWYYYKNGSAVTNAWIGNYWLGADGKMVTNSWVDNNKYYVGSNGAWIPSVNNGWMKENNAWYYYKNGSAVTNTWIGNYWLGADGKMVTNSWVDNNKYYVGSNGAWVKDALHPGEKRGWTKEGSAWYYYKNNDPVTNTWIGSYYLKADGKMATSEWIYDNYYQGWYYLNADGSYARNTWIGNYWLTNYGKMATNSWVDNGKYYVGSNGAWVPQTSSNASALNMPQFYQGDARWGGKVYGRANMKASGCVPTSLAMIFSGLGQSVSPVQVANTIYNNTNEMNVNGVGTSGLGAAYAIEAYGYNYSVITSKAQLIAALQSGKPVFATMGYGIFAKGANTHAIILSGYNNGKTKAMDPDNSYTTQKWYDINTIWNQRSQDPYDTSVGGSFIAIG